MLRTSDLTEDGLASDDNGVFLDGPIPPTQVLFENDLLVSRAGTIGRSYLVPRSGAGNTFAGFLIRFRPRREVNSRFLRYALRSKFTQDQIRAEAVMSTILNFNAERYANLRIPDTSGEEQRRIAEFLDDRVARIDQIIAARRRQTANIAEKWAGELEAVLESISERTRASRVVKVLPGFAFPSGEYSEDQNDRRLLRGVNVGIGATRWGEVSYWPEERVDEVREFVLHAGDIVIGMDRPWIGDGLRIACVTEDDGDPLLLQRVARLSSTEMSSEYLFWAYQSRRFRDQVETDLTGLSVPHLSGDQIGSFDIPVCDVRQQIEVVNELQAGSESMRRVIAMLDASIDRLSEYKQSLITAAVTGELDVTTAGSGIPG